MDILKQCQKWHENDEFQKIVDALEAIPSLERTGEMDCELARAYNNLAAYSSTDDCISYEGRAMLKKAVGLLKLHEEDFGDDFSWNYRMGYAYLYLDQESRALPYLYKALKTHPEDEDTKTLIDFCKNMISYPQFSKCFWKRTKDCWEAFAEMEAKLRQMIEDNNLEKTGTSQILKEDQLSTVAQEIMDQIDLSLHLVFDEISFEIGVNGEKYELILTPEGDKVKLFELVYFKNHAPKEVLLHWNILVGRQPFQNKGLLFYDGNNISSDDVQVWLEEQDENCFMLYAYCEKLLPMLSEKAGEAWWLLFTITDQVLGEISHMHYIDDFEVLTEPKTEPSILMSDLSEMLKERGLDLNSDPETYLKTYTEYQMEPNDDPNADWRLDVIAGVTNCEPLITSYLDANNDCVNMLHADGAVAGFFCYPLDTLRDEKETNKIFDFRDSLMKYLIEHCSDALTFTGSATGIYCGYVDFIAWDIQTTLQAAKVFFEDSCIPWANFHTFRREAKTVSLKN